MAKERIGNLKNSVPTIRDLCGKDSPSRVQLEQTPIQTTTDLRRQLDRKDTSQGPQSKDLEMTTLCAVVVCSSTGLYTVLIRIRIPPLPPRLPPILAPREMRDRQDEERIRWVRDTSQHVIPRDERRKDSKHAACSGQRHVWVAVGLIPGIEVCASKADKGQPYHQEQAGEGDSGAECQQPKHECEDEPGKYLVLLVRGFGAVPAQVTYVEAKGCVKVGSFAAVSLSNLEASWNEKNRCADPKSTVRR